LTFRAQSATNWRINVCYAPPLVRFFVLKTEERL
jgi:hypothetical protein